MKSSATIIHQPTVEAENMSNLTNSASGTEASVSSNNDVSTYPVKKKRNQPGHPDPDAEVIALSPKTLMATNRFVCEVCSKGFQRDQNLQLHRRGHNLPWKLKQRANKEVVRKKVYVCPETSCVHHDPSRALGDLTGIKKHFCRKHGEKKWKCDKCSKRYAVQSDWKAHSKTCGTREYRCDCGTLFSRRDSFITHRAFCDALADEGVRSSMAGNSTIPLHINLQSQLMKNVNHEFPQFSVKKEQQSLGSSRPEIPPWLVGPRPPPIDLPTPTASSSPSIFQGFHQNPNPSSSSSSIGLEPTSLLPFPYLPPPPAHISATALLQKAAQLGAKSSSTTCSSPAGVVIRPHHHAHGSDEQPAGIATAITSATATTGPDLSSRDQLLAACGNKADTVATGGGASPAGDPSITTHPHPPPTNFIHEMMMMNHHTMLGFGEMDQFGGMGNLLMTHHSPLKKDQIQDHHQGLDFPLGEFNRSDQGMTRDFLGLRNLSQSDILSIAGFSNCINNVTNHHHQSPKPSWQG